MAAVTERLMFDHVVEGMFHRALGKRLSAAGREQLRAAGLDLSKPLRPAYPMEQYFGFLEIAAKVCMQASRWPRACMRWARASSTGTSTR